PARRSPLFPYTTLFRSEDVHAANFGQICVCANSQTDNSSVGDTQQQQQQQHVPNAALCSSLCSLSLSLSLSSVLVLALYCTPLGDRKSTRLNSSHVKIS